MNFSEEQIEYSKKVVSMIDKKINPNGIYLNDDMKIFVEFAVSSHFIPKKDEFGKIIKVIHVRKNSGNPYWTHLIRVALSSLIKSNKIETFAIGMFHDIVEDTDVSLNDIKDFLIYQNYDEKFIETVINSVDQLTEKVTKEKYPNTNRKERKKMELVKYGTLSEISALVKQEDIRDNFVSVDGYKYANQGSFNVIWVREAIEKLKVLKQILNDNFDSNLFDELNQFVENK